MLLGELELFIELARESLQRCSVIGRIPGVVRQQDDLFIAELALRATPLSGTSKSRISFGPGPSPAAAIASETSVFPDNRRPTSAPIWTECIALWAASPKSIGMRSHGRRAACFQ